jgi:hypothetical protein
MGQSAQHKAPDQPPQHRLVGEVMAEQRTVKVLRMWSYDE